MDTKEKINQLRLAIDNYDDQQRFSVSKEIGKIKSAENLKVGDPNREEEIIDRLANKLDGKLDRDDISAIFGPIYTISKKLQKK